MSSIKGFMYKNTCNCSLFMCKIEGALCLFDMCSYVINISFLAKKVVIRLM